MRTFFLGELPREGSLAFFERLLRQSRAYRVGLEKAEESIATSVGWTPALEGLLRLLEMTPRSCIIKDDMAAVIQKLLWADVILLSFPRYCSGVPGPLKNLLDR